jgi:hypothetical protein
LAKAGPETARPARATAAIAVRRLRFFKAIILI